MSLYNLNARGKQGTVPFWCRARGRTPLTDVTVVILAVVLKIDETY